MGTIKYPQIPGGYAGRRDEWEAGRAVSPVLHYATTKEAIFALYYSDAEQRHLDDCIHKQQLSWRRVNQS